jgi:glucans biosynthesis protein
MVPSARTAVGAKLTAVEIDRRRVLEGLAGLAALSSFGLPRGAAAQDAASPDTAGAATAEASPAAQPVPFSFDWLTEEMRRRSGEPFKAPDAPQGFLADLDYDSYRAIRFRPDHARWSEDDLFFRLHAFHLGWLFKEPVELYEVVDGNATPMTFSSADFEYDNGLADRVPAHLEMPGVAGFRLHAPLNRSDIYDEVVVFQGASYFRALGRGNTYGLSARGIAVNTGSGQPEEFPRFTAFWLDRPAPGSTEMTFFAALDSPSVTGAYRFTLAPGETTRMDVTARLFMRNDVAQLGIAPLTSMYLLGEADPGNFDDFRPRVHDSEALIVNMRGGDTLYRPLQNPPRLASSYLAASNPGSFGLVQRTRDFDHYLDAGAHYEKRPSLMVEPLGDWGKGTIRLVEIPSDLEANDNIVAFWVPEAPARKGDAIEASYRLSWGMSPDNAMPTDLAHVVRTRVGHGGVSGVERTSDRRKFVVDFKGGTLSELPADADVSSEVQVSTGEVSETVLSRVSGTDIWRLVIEVSADQGALVELRASINGYGRTLSETWLYQWIKE